MIVGTVAVSVQRAIEFLVVVRERIFLRLEVRRHMHARQSSPKIGFNSLRPIVSSVDGPRTRNQDMECDKRTRTCLPRA